MRCRAANGWVYFATERPADEEIPARVEQGRGRKWEPAPRFMETLLGESPQEIVAALDTAIGEGATPVQLAR